MRVFMVALMASLSAACVSQVAVLPVEPSAPPERADGLYAALIIANTSPLNAKSDGLVCGEWTFRIGLDDQFEASVRSALERSVQHVDFIERPISPEQLHERGYRALITVRHVDARAAFSASERLLFRDVRATVELAANLTVDDAQGLFFHTSLAARGVRDRETFGCSSIADAVGDSAHDALQMLVDDTVAHLARATRRVAGSTN